MSRSGGDDRQTTDRQTDCLTPAAHAHARMRDNNCEYQLVGTETWRVACGQRLST